MSVEPKTLEITGFLFVFYFAFGVQGSQNEVWAIGRLAKLGASGYSLSCYFYLHSLSEFYLDAQNPH